MKLLVIRPDPDPQPPDPWQEMLDSIPLTPVRIAGVSYGDTVIVLPRDDPDATR